MFTTSCKAAVLAGFFLVAASGLEAQSLTLAPSGYVTVSTGGTVQFTPAASGFTIAALKWEVASVQGGSAGTGTITTGLTGGLYTAPATIPAQNPESILLVATDTNGNKYSASTSITILPPPPLITSVSPNPLSAGTAMVTVTGNGFSSGASTIWVSGVQYATQQPTTNTLTASAYIPAAATSVSIAVHSNGTVSNAIVVPVGNAAPATYTLTVVNGTGSGNYAPGTVVNISANAPPSGQQFQSWSGATVASAGSSSTTLTMPAGNTTVTAGYTVSTPTTYTLTVLNGTGSGNYAAGTVVNISANAPPSGQRFQIWSGATVASTNSASTSLTMPAANTTVSAQFVATGPVITSVTPNPLPAGTVTVSVNGTGFTAASNIWVGGVQYAAQLNGNTLTTSIYISPGTSSVIVTVNNVGTISNAVTVPVAGPPTYTLTVVNGSGSGTYTGGTVVSISANTAPTGQQFQSWSGATVANSAAASTSITMPAANTTVTAGYAAAGPVTYALTVVGGTGSGNYAAGTIVNIGATVPSGQQFQGWTGAMVASSSSASTSLTMPSANTTVTAQFAASVLAITSVSPNPLSPGTVTVTISGTGFTASSAIWIGSVQYSAQLTPAGALTASIYIAPGTPSVTFTVNSGGSASNAVTVPVAGPPTYTLTVVNGTGGGAYTAGTAVTITANAPPSGEAFQSWTGSVVANAESVTTTITMPSTSVTVSANYYTPAPVPFPVTTHPRLWITTQDLPRLQNWATSTNIAYQGLLGPLSTAIGNYMSAFPGASLDAVNPTPASPYPDFGDDQGYTGMLSEENAVILAFNSLIDPSAVNRASYAQAARNLLMYAMNQAALGPQNGAPFRDSSFPIYNRGSFTGHEWPLIVDWIYPILTASDKATIQSVFLIWANECLNAETTGGDNPGTPGLENSLALLTWHGQANVPYRMSSNNYYLAHARMLTMMSLALDPADDSPVNAAIPVSALGNTVRSYIPDATGAWLYEEFAMMGDPQVVAQAYGVPNNPTGAGLGLASGGLPPEGMLYGESFGYVLGQLLALQTAGFNSAALSGPQINMIGAPVWDRWVQGYISSLVPAAQTFASESYLGSVYQYAGYGDLLRTYVTQDFMTPFSLLGLLDQENGVSTHVNAVRWFALNATPGGAPALLTRMTDPWTWGVTQDLLYFMLLDPTAPAATDPRPGYPTTFYDAPAGRVVAHSDWTPKGNMFDFKAGWISINHQDGNGGQFELYRKGEWLTKEMSNYDSGGNGNGATVTFHNTLGLQNWCGICFTQTINWQGTDAPAWANGGQWMEGGNAGDPTTTMSAGPGYVYANSDLTNLYNKPALFSPTANLAVATVADIQQATRSILWLNDDYIVIYDRATSGHNGFKRFNLSLVMNPMISGGGTAAAPAGATAVPGNTATETLASGQQLFIQTLLPLNPSLTSFYGPGEMGPGALADLEPTQYVYQVQDPSNPLDTRFLHVLQGADAGAAMVPATYVQSTSGTPFDGAQFGSNEVWFPVSTATAFGGAAFPAAGGIHSMTIAGLAPNAGYSVTVQPNGNGNTVSVFPGARMQRLIRLVC